MKYLSFIAVLSSITLTAQVRFNHQFDLEYPFEVFTSIFPTDSCYYVTGVVTDPNTGTLGNIFLKLNLEGEIEFEKLLSAVGKNYVTTWGDLTPVQGGGFYEIGTVTDSVTKILLIKYDMSGDTIFTKEYLSPFYPVSTFMYAAEIRVNEEGSLFVLCRAKADSLQNDQDIYLLKLTENGEIIDSFFYGGQHSDIPKSMILDSDGNPIIGSQITNFTQLPPGKFSRCQIFKIHETGEILWQYQTPFNQLIDAADDMILSPDGSIVVATGKGIEHVVNPAYSLLKWFPYVFKLNANHEFEWGIELRGTRQDLFSFVKIVSAHDESGYIATGRIGEDVSLGEEILGSWVVKVSPQGDSLWARYYSVFDDVITRPQPYDLKKTPDGGYVVIGDTSPDTPGGQAQRAWMMKLDQHGCLIPGCEEGDTVVLASGQALEVPLQLAIYPNPTSDFLNFQLRTARPVQAATFRIVDIAGRVVREIQSAGAKDTHIVPVQGWATGVYFLQYLEDGQVRAVERFVVE